MLILLVCLISTVGSLTAHDGSLTKAQQQFSLELFQEIANKASYNKNVFLSPYSIYSGLLTVYVASAGKTEKSLQSFLRFNKSSIPDKSLIKAEYFNFTSEGKEYTLASVDRVYYSPDFKVKKDRQSQFGAKVGVFKTQNDRDEEINKWVSDNTKGNIQKLLKKGSINSSSTIVFERKVNAAYFKAYWTIPITDGTSKKPFTLHDGTVRETMFMSLDDSFFPVVTDTFLKAKYISLPYKGNDISMIIILPMKKPQKNAPPPLADVVKKLTSNKFQNILTTLKTDKFCTTDLLIPKFESEETYDLKQIFEALGDKELFSQPLDLTDLFEPGAPLIVDKVVHQAKVSVYENGTEAAAATAEINAGSAEPPGPQCTTTFYADHPFLYAIYHNKGDTIQYIGIFNTPKE